MKGVMDYCDESDHGALWCHGSWRIVMMRAMEHCDDRYHGAL